MKIVYCIHATFNSGGMERVLVNKANYMVEKYGYEILIVTTEQKGRDPFFPLASSIKQIDLNINYADDADYGVFIKGYSFFKKKKMHRKKLEELLYSYKPNIVISMFGAESSFLYKIKDGSKKIIEIHFSKFFRMQYGRKGLWKFSDFIRTRMDEWIVKQYDKFIVLTNEDQGYWGNLKNIMVISNPAKSFSDRISSLTNPQIIAVGRLSYQKGYDRLIKAWSIVKKERRDWTLHIYGNGELYDELLMQIDQLGMLDDIHIHSQCKEMEDIYLNASTLVLSSRYEGLPMVLLEAMSCGLPIISFDCKCGPKDVITDSVDGFLVKEGDIHEFADKILCLIDHQELRRSMGKNAKLKSMQFSEEIIMRKWVKMFKEICLK
jgi:glycosyltransferase involved in cell wall biosynthesis